MKVTVEFSDSELRDICRLTGERKKGPAIRRVLMLSALMMKQRKEIAGNFISGEWGVELKSFKAARSANRTATTSTGRRSRQN